MKISTQNLKNDDSFRLRQLAQKNSLRGDDDRRRNTQMSIRLRNMRYSINNSSTNIGKCLKIKIKISMKNKQRYLLIIKKICVRFTLFPVVLKKNSKRSTNILDLFGKFIFFTAQNIKIFFPFIYHIMRCTKGKILSGRTDVCIE